MPECSAERMKTAPVDAIAEFEAERRKVISSYADETAWRNLSGQWLENAFRKQYMYNFSWLGRPIIQLPADIVAFQELVWKVRPDLIVETGIAHGGSLILSASMLALLDYCDAAEQGATLDPARPRRRVLGVDIDIRAHNRKAIEDHPLARSIDMIEGSSIGEDTIRKVGSIAAGFSRILVCLDSSHTHEHVLAELRAYAPLVSRHSYCIVFDTVVEDLPDDMFPNRPWRPGNSPKTAVHAYIQELEATSARGTDGQELRFEIDTPLDRKLLLNATPDGFLKRI